jgi:hypothetical protein
VWGDPASGFYRRRVLGNDPIGRDRLEGVTTDEPDLVVVDDSESDKSVKNKTFEWTATEAFSWGGLTSGPASRALWLLFLPFILINLAHWMLPPTKCTKAASAAVCLLRLLGLALTLTLLLTAADLLLNVIGWQCVAEQLCVAKLGPLQFLKTWPLGWVLVVAAVPIAALVLGLLVIGRSNPRLGELPPDPAEAFTDRSPLSKPSFWNDDDSMTCLRHCHVAAWLCGLGILVLLGPANASSGQERNINREFMIGNAVFLFVAALAVGSKKWTGRNDTKTPKHATRWTRGLWIASLAVLIFSLGRVGSTFTSADVGVVKPGSSALPGIEVALESLIVTQAVLLISLFVAIWRSKALPDQPEDGYEYSLHGMTAGFVATMAFLFGGGISLGAGVWLARYLGEPVPGGMPGRNPKEAPIVLSDIYFGGALANVMLLFVALATAAVIFCHVRRVKKRYLERIQTAELPIGYPPVDPAISDPETRAWLQDLRLRRIASIAGAWAWARVTDSAPRIVAALVAVAVVNVAAWYAFYVLHRPTEGWLVGVVTACGALTALLMGGFIAFAYKAFRQIGTRRGVGVLWDVMTFWPQASHPFGPPCYGERAVPDLRDRVQELTTESSSVVLATHSQGTIIAAAALLLNSAPSGTVSEGDTGSGDADATTDTSFSFPDRVALLTFGSPLRRLYARNFPAYFGFKVLTDLQDAAAERWINLWAHTDPIGGWIFGCSELDRRNDESVFDWWLRDATGALPVDGSYPPICHHSGFWLRDEYGESLDALAARIPIPSAYPGVGEEAEMDLLEPPMSAVAPPEAVPTLRRPSAAE